MDAEKKIKSSLKNLLKESEGEESDRKILFDDFVQGLVSRLTSKDARSVSKNGLQDTIKKHSLRKMFKADDKDEYYNYKSRYYKAPEIAQSVMHFIQNGPDRADEMGNPKFVDYANVSQDMSIFEGGDSATSRKMVDLACEYKKRSNNGGGEDRLEEFFDGMPGSLKEKIKNFSENISEDELEEYSGEPKSANPVTENFEESKIRRVVRDVLTDLKKKLKESSNPEKIEKELEKAARSGNARRYQNITIVPYVAKKALEVAEKVEMSKASFFSKPLSQILAIATENM